jgi:hypothetical protein
MPHTKSKAQTRARGSKVPGNQSTRRVRTGRITRSAARSRLRQLPLRGPNTIGKSIRGQAERYYAGDTTRRFDVARGKRLGVGDAANRYGRGVPMGETMRTKSRNERRRPRKVAASSGKPRNKLGRAPARRKRAAGF